MNRQNDAADPAHADQERKASITRFSYNYLAHEAAPDVVGVTLMFPDGSTTYISREDALRLLGSTKPAGACS